MKSGHRRPGLTVRAGQRSICRHRHGGRHERVPARVPEDLRGHVQCPDGRPGAWRRRGAGAEERRNAARGLLHRGGTMDPHLSGSKVDRQVYHNIYEPLVTLDTKLGIRPGLAESWSQPDPKTLVFKLRRGVKFHDGTDFTAEAAKFNFDRMKTEPKSIRKGEVANIESVDVVDPFTIKINLKKPDASLLATLTDRAGMMVSPKVVQE